MPRPRRAGAGRLRDPRSPGRGPRRPPRRGGASAPAASARRSAGTAAASTAPGSRPSPTACTARCNARRRPGGGFRLPVAEIVGVDRGEQLELGQCAVRPHAIARGGAVELPVRELPGDAPPASVVPAQALEFGLAAGQRGRGRHRQELRQHPVVGRLGLQRRLVEPARLAVGLAARPVVLVARLLAAVRARCRCASRSPPPCPAARPAPSGRAARPAPCTSSPCRGGSACRAAPARPRPAPDRARRRARPGRRRRRRAGPCART